MADPTPFAVSPTEAIGFLRDKVRVPTERWTDMWQGMHARAFVVAGAQSDALLADFHEAVNRNIAEGRTLEQFRADFDRIVEDHGWSYNGSRNWRSRVIFETNLRMAYAAGRWAQIQRVKQSRPYLRYVHVEEQLHPRFQHHLWHNAVLPVDHPWWQTHFPPNGWGCKCSVQSVNDRDLTRLGLKVSPVAPPSPLVNRTINTASGPVTIKVPDGIDPGFAYNVGRAGFGAGQELMALERHGQWLPLEAEGAATARTQLPVDALDTPLPAAPKGDEEALRAGLRAAIGGDELIVEDPTGARVRLTQAIVDNMLADAARHDGRERYFPLMPGLVADPAEIWLGWVQSAVTGRVALRRRYVKLVDLGNGTAIGLIADSDGGEWSGLTFFRGSRDGAQPLRVGRLIFQR